MRLNYKKIKTVLLLSAFGCFWQSSPLAMEDPQENGGGYKRKREEDGESTQQQQPQQYNLMGLCQEGEGIERKPEQNTDRKNKKQKITPARCSMFGDLVDDIQKEILQIICISNLKGNYSTPTVLCIGSM
jgi:hypothetical protein